MNCCLKNMKKIILFLFYITVLLTPVPASSENVHVLTVATDDTHGLQRFLRSAKIYDIPVNILGRGDLWTGGDMHYAGGGQKVRLLKQKLEELSEDNSNKNETIILFTDSYDVMFLDKLDIILSKFKNFDDTRVLFSAEQFCWPNANLASQYPNSETDNPYLNSGGFIGYLPELVEILNYKKINDKDDDQLYYTKIYLDPKLRKSLKISLDHKSEIFQNLNGALSDVELKVNQTVWPYIENIATKERPVILHGNGPSKITLNHLGNYLARSWSPIEGCAHCSETKIQLKDNEMPHVMLAVFIEQPTPFLEEFLLQLLEIDYPKNKILLFLRNNVEFHEAEVEEFYQAHSKEFISAKRIKPSDFISEAEARNIASERCQNAACDYVFSIDSVSRIKSFTLRHLVTSGFDIIAPMLVRPGQAWSNFWGAVNSAGFYARSSDYMDIVYDARKGTWNVPFVTNCYLVKTSVLKAWYAKHVTFFKEDVDPDMAFCASLREAGIFMHVTNEFNFGHLVNPETFDITKTNPDVYQVIDNRIEWENRYLHEDYSQNFAEGQKILMPCPDVYWFPVMTERFCKEWIEVAEAFGQWSDGTPYDKRLDSGYEAVPTRDIHMNQINLDRQWLYILKEYVRPLQELVFTGYYHNPPTSVMNFIVRYRPDEQPSLRPHHDSSTYTINLALNNKHLDYEGGGCKFIRYNCSVEDTKQGWLLMHPGRLTHFHEGLRVTNGTRYIMISFVDP